MAQVATAVVPEQVFPADLQTGSVVHVHCAVPAEPAQVR